LPRCKVFYDGSSVPTAPLLNGIRPEAAQKEKGREVAWGGGRGEEGRQQTSGDRDKKEKKSKTQKETKRRGDDDYGGRDPPCI
jgi:hypothetical protein